MEIGLGLGLFCDLGSSGSVGAEDVVQFEVVERKDSWV